MPVDVLELSIHSPIYDEKMAEKSKADLILTRSAGQMPGNATNQELERATAYVCENYVCKLLTTDPQTMARFLENRN